MGRTSRLSALATALLLLVYWWLLRLRLYNWGATDEERRLPLPGDELIPQPERQCTRAVVIRSSVESVWPWLAQLGQHQAGLYSYNWIENLLGFDMVNIDWVVPRFQMLQPGDTIWLASRRRFGQRAFAVVATVVPNKALVLVTQPWTDLRPRPEFAVTPQCGTWAFVLRVDGPRQTRLLVRNRSGCQLRSRERLVQLALEPVRFAMERKMLLTIKRLAEQREARSVRDRREFSG